MSCKGNLYIKGKYSNGRTPDASIYADSILGVLSELSHYALTMIDDDTTEIRIVVKRKEEK